MGTGTWGEEHTRGRSFRYHSTITKEPSLCYVTSLHVVEYAHDGIVSQVVVAVVHRLQHGRDAAFLFHVFLDGGGFVEDCTSHRMECFPQRLPGDFVF